MLRVHSFFPIFWKLLFGFSSTLPILAIEIAQYLTLKSVMKGSHMLRRRAQITLTALVFSLGLSETLQSKDPKLTPEELVNRHVQSIGSTEVIQKVQSRAINGTMVATTKLGRAGTMAGRASILSKGPKTRVSLIMDVPDYPSEQFTFDGNRTAGGSLRPELHAPLSEFVHLNGVLMREGLIGGVLTTAWPLLDLPNRKPLLSYGGLKKVDGKEYHTLKYKPNKGAMAANVTLFFDPETFRHVRSQYGVENSGGTGSITPGGAGGGQAPGLARVQLIEEFGDFKEKDGLQLPHSYTIRFSGDTGSGTLLATWTVTVTALDHNNPTIEDKHFAIR